MATEWQPIETAPKGRAILIGFDGRDNRYPSKWVTQGYYEVVEGHEGFYCAGEHWTDSYADKMYPTHWMPLPSPPGAAP